MPSLLFPVEVLVVFGVPGAVVAVALSEGLAAVELAELSVFVPASIKGFVKSLAAANTGIVGRVSAAVAMANSASRIPYPVLSSHSGTSMSVAVFRRRFLICWRLRDGLAAHILEMVVVTKAAAIDVPCLVSVVEVSAVCAVLVGARISKPPP